MKLELTQKLQQQQILAPQMILSMDILLLPTLDLEQRIQKEFAENPALELIEAVGKERAHRELGASTRSSESSESFGRIEQFEAPYSSELAPRRRSSASADSKHEALQNTEGDPPGLKESLMQQLRLRNLARGVEEVAAAIVNSLDERGYLKEPLESVLEGIEHGASESEIEEAYRTVRQLDPAGVGARDLADCLLLQLERDPQEYPLEVAIIREHLRDLALNRLPRIAKELGRTLDEVKDAVEIISSLDPFPGGRLESSRTIYVRPDVEVIERDGELEIRVEDLDVPGLQVSASCRQALKASRKDKETASFLRKKIESAQWLIQAVEQRKRTIRDIAVALVDYQRKFMLHGPEHLRALKMQTLADLVGVHISTISRATKGKYIQTPHGLFELKYFFTGGVENERGEVESRRNVYRIIGDLIEAEDKRKPLSDTQIAKRLNEEGLHIARRTVTKYREQESIPSSRLRRTY